MRHTQAGLLTEASNAVFPLLGMRHPMSAKNHSANTATALCGTVTRFPFHPPFGGHLCTLIFTCYFYYGTPGAICQQNTKIGSAFLGVEILQSAFKMLIFSDARISS